MKLNAQPLDRTRADLRIQIARPQAGQCWRGIATAFQWATVHTHFLDGRTRPCPLPDAPCRACEQGLRKEFAAYLGWYNESLRVPQVLALPEGAYEKASALIGADNCCRVRGWRLQFRRPSHSARAQLEVETLGREEHRSIIPDGLDVPGILWRAWGFSGRPPRDMYDPQCLCRTKQTAATA